MRSLRTFLTWVFAISALCCLEIVIQSALQMRRDENSGYPPPVFGWLFAPVLFSVIMFVFAMAWWTNFREKPSSRGWSIAASVANILGALFPVAIYLPFSHNLAELEAMLVVVLIGLGIGVVGVITFAHPASPSEIQKDWAEKTNLPGDGTVKILNHLSGVLIAVLGMMLLEWWARWTWRHNIPRPDGGIGIILLWLFLLSFFIAVVHELGHTVTGLALGMRLRVFYVGPFQWHMRDGRWEFKFAPLEILNGGGATGVVPASARLNTWRHVAKDAAGPLANLVTGAALLWGVNSTNLEVAGVNTGFMALLGAFSVAAFVWNLIPMRMGGQYTDGAHIYQLLSGGPWGDYHRIIAEVTSSLVTSTRPKDYDIQKIERAAQAIGTGREGLLLRFFSHAYHLDRGEQSESAQALREAALVYEQSASHVSGELLTVFVFGAAYLLRDAAAARQWWEQMEAKNVKRFNVDYWRAKSALYWIEGNLQEANEAWAKSDAAAQKLPHAGAYEFDRSQCGLLREAIDATAAERAGSSEGSFAR